jgi:hypothetical protein
MFGETSEGQHATNYTIPTACGYGTILFDPQPDPNIHMPRITLTMYVICRRFLYVNKCHRLRGMRRSVRHWA